MVDVTRATGVYQEQAANKDNRRSQRDGEHPEGGHDQDAFHQRMRQVSQVTDITQIMGVPTSEMTPRVQEAFSAIITEFDRTRAELQFERERITRLEEQVDRHPVLPASNRRVLLRELARIINRAAQTRTTSSLGVFSLQGIEQVRLEQGRAAADRILTAVVQTLHGALRASDVVSSLGGADFAVILALTEGAPARDKIVSLTKDIQTALRDRGVDGTVAEIAWGLVPFGETDEAEKVLAAADRDLLARRLGRV